MNLGVREESKQKARCKRASLVGKRSCSEVRGNLEKEGNPPVPSAVSKIGMENANGDNLPRGFGHSHISVKHRSHDNHWNPTILPVFAA